ncbi:L-lactate permease [Variovorax sp. CY25R-8]|uniref:L-lactate permease n=1 Tax=Variovorax sp. CY25R-8 TaxID=2855501 RepID=UPI0021BAB145|nr:L-lactate permease [Variovorax sp. CY25R-8]MCT8180836.1 L-lactate permease [Variovorax sp. CY25R-8]
MFHQLTMPIGGALLPTFIVAALPITTVLLMLGVLRRPGWQAGLAGLGVGLAVAVYGWQFPVGMAFNAVALGAVLAVWPVMWVVVAAIFLFNMTIRAGRLDAFRVWVLDNVPNDRRVVLLVVGFLFGSLLEAVAGTGTPIAITSALLVTLGFPVLDALVFMLIFDTVPVAFGAMGLPITVLAAVTGLPAAELGQMAGRQLPFFAFLLPFYVLTIYSGVKGLRAVWPLALVAGGSFAITQFLAANFLSYAICDVLAAIVAIVVTMTFLRYWKPAPDAHYHVNIDRASIARTSVTGRQSWYPWLIVAVIAVGWTVANLGKIGEVSIPWPGLDKAVYITVYQKAYPAVWSFQPLTTGTAVLVAALVSAVVMRLSVRDFFGAAKDTLRQTAVPVATVAMIIGLAYLMNYSGMTYSLGLGIVAVGPWFPFVSAFLGWIAVFLTGSDTSGNALFGNMQVVAANQLGLSPTLMAATNSTGGVFGKMISPQSIACGVATTGMHGKEGAIVARTFKHSIFLTLLLGVLVWLQQNHLHWMIPGH